MLFICFIISFASYSFSHILFFLSIRDKINRPSIAVEIPCFRVRTILLNMESHSVLLLNRYAPENAFGAQLACCSVIGTFIK